MEYDVELSRRLVKVESLIEHLLDVMYEVLLELDLENAMPKV